METLPYNGRYKLSDDQEFRDLEEAQKFILVNCLYCQGSVSCKDVVFLTRHRWDILHELRLSMANNSPYWSKEFVRLELSEDYSRSYSHTTKRSIPKKAIVCRRFNPKQLEFEFMK